MNTMKKGSTLLAGAAIALLAVGCSDGPTTTSEQDLVDDPEFGFLWPDGVVPDFAELRDLWPDNAGPGVVGGGAVRSGGLAACVTLRFTPTTFASTVVEQGIRYGSVHPSTPHIHQFGGRLLNHTGSATPYEFRRVDGSPFTVKRLDMSRWSGGPTGTFVSSSGAVLGVPYADITVTFPSGFSGITFFRWHEAGFGGRFIDNLEICPAGANLLIIDEESIDNGNPPNFFSDVDVNDPIANIGQRAQLAFFAANAGNTITLHTGEVGDEGWFALKTIPASWDAAGPTGDGLSNYVAAGPGLGRPDVNGDREALLDKIPDVTPLRATGLKLLEGERVCAVVYDSDVSINYDPLDGSLKGDNLGTVAFEVLSVTKLDGFSSSSLPKVDIRILDADQVCEGSLTLFEDAPEPVSSSEPFDVDPPEEDDGEAS